MEPASPGGNLPLQLTERERLIVARYAQSGDLERATNLYLSFSLPGWSDQRITSHTGDPTLRQLFDNCAMYIFVNGTDSFINSPENLEALVRYAGGRPLTVSLLRTAWEHTKANGVQPQQTQEPEPEPIDLNSLSDSEVEQALAAARKARAAQLRRR